MSDIIRTRTVLLHVSASDDITRAQETARGLRETLGDIDVRVIVNGPAIAATTKSAAEPLQLVDGDAPIIVCATGMRRRGLDERDLLPGLETTPSAAVYLAERQWAGAAYIRL